MICPFVFTSGAGISIFSPKYLCSPLTYPLANLSNSPWDRLVGSTDIPPLAPPYGIPVTQHLKVIQIDKAFTSSKFTVGWNLTPPLPGPMASLCKDL